MKRLILACAAAAAVAAPLAMSAQPAHADSWRERRDDRWERRQDRWDRSHDRWDRGHDRWERRGWDRGRHNGYYYRNRWHYGPPPTAYYDSPHYRPGYTAWRRGAYLPRSHRGYVVYDYGRYRLRPPPRGYAWYRVDDDYMLAAITTGLIYDIIRGR